ncbi:MAG TPA: hypothetical protein ENG21_00780 [Nitrososphaeria archaeon]|nr:hypothetical protein [Nitrososphaeria archaeon]
MRLTVLILALLILTAFTIPSSAGEPKNVPIKHFIVLIQENSSFDHFFGTFPGAKGFPENYSMPVDPSDPRAGRVRPFKLPYPNTISLPHNKKASSIAYNGGLMNGFIRAGNMYGLNGTLAMGYYDRDTIPLYWNLAEEYVLFDMWFASYRGGCLQNALYLYAGQMGGYEKESIPEEGFNLRTIFDELDQKGISWKIYMANYDPNANYTDFKARVMLTPKYSQIARNPLLAIPRFVHNKTLNSRIVDLREYYTDLKQGTLPQVSFVIPSPYCGRSPTDVILNQYLVVDIVNALIKSRYWNESALLILWIDGGGWADHVTPPTDFGFRVPAILISPYARRGYIDSEIRDHTSVLKFIEWLYDLPPLTERDARARNLLSAFTFSEPREAVFPVELAGEPVDSERNRVLRGIITSSYGFMLIGVAFLIISAFFYRVRRKNEELAWAEVREADRVNIVSLFIASVVAFILVYLISILAFNLSVTIAIIISLYAVLAGLLILLAFLVVMNR